MLKTLLKKQMMEIFRSYFYDGKKNKRRSKFATAMYIIMYAVLMLGILGGMFAYLAFSLCGPFASVGMGWMYFTIIGLISIFLGTFGSVFNTFSSLYMAKDNDLLLSLPIPVRHIMTARLLSVYLMGLMYSSVVIIPALIVYWISADFSVMAVLGGILLMLLISIIVMILSCVLGWIVAKISLKLKNRSFITVIISLAFFGLYYFFYFRAQQMINDLIANVIAYGESIRGSAYPLYLFGRIGEGDAIAMAIVTAVVLAAFAITMFIISRSFIKIATSSGNSEKTVYREKKAKTLSTSRALLKKEFKRFTSSPMYMLNCGMGTLMLPICGILILVKGNEFLSVLYQIFDEMEGCISVMMCAGICLIAAMNDMAAPSISLEGKSLWIMQSLPVTPWQILRAKLSMHMLLTAIPTLFCSICVAIMLDAPMLERIMVILMPMAFVTFFACLALYAGIKLPNLNWTNETVPLKQGGSVMISLLGGWVYALAFGGIYMLCNLGFIMSAWSYIALFFAITAILAAIIFKMIKHSGASTFANL